MSLKLTLAALALGLAAATDCCTYEPNGCNCDAEPMAGCFKTGEEPFSDPKPKAPSGFRPNVDIDYCDPEDYLAAFATSPDGFPKCEKDLTAPTPDGETTFCCGGFFFDIKEYDGDCETVAGEEQCCVVDGSAEELANCFAFCEWNWCPGNPNAPFNRVENPDFNPPPPNPNNDPTRPEDKDETLCFPKTEPPTPAPQENQFFCPPDLQDCTLGGDSGCPEDTQCCPFPSSRRRRLNFYQSTGCCCNDCGTCFE